MFYRNGICAVLVLVSDTNDTDKKQQLHLMSPYNTDNKIGLVVQRAYIMKCCDNKRNTQTGDKWSA